MEYMIKLLVRVDEFPLEWTVTKKDCPEEQATEGKYLYAVWSAYQKDRTTDKKEKKKETTKLKLTGGKAA